VLIVSLGARCGWVERENWNDKLFWSPRGGNYIIYSSRGNVAACVVRQNCSSCYIFMSFENKSPAQVAKLQKDSYTYNWTLEVISTCVSLEIQFI